MVCEAFEGYAKQAKQVKSDLQSARSIINNDIDVWVPCQGLVWLGLFWNLVKRVLEIPETRLLKMESAISVIVDTLYGVSARKLAHLAGLLMYLLNAAFSCMQNGFQGEWISNLIISVGLWILGTGEYFVFVVCILYGVHLLLIDSQIIRMPSNLDSIQSFEIQGLEAVNCFSISRSYEKNYLVPSINFCQDVLRHFLQCEAERGFLSRLKGFPRLIGHFVYRNGEKGNFYCRSLIDSKFGRYICGWPFEESLVFLFVCLFFFFWR